MKYEILCSKVVGSFITFKNNVYKYYDFTPKEDEDVDIRKSNKMKT